MKEKSLIAGLAALLFLPTITSAQAYETGINTTCLNSGLYAKLQFTVYNRTDPGVPIPGGQIVVDFTQPPFMSNPNQYYACSNSVTADGYSKCEFEANKNPGAYYLTIYYSGYYTETGELVAKPSTETKMCVYAY